MSKKLGDNTTNKIYASGNPSALAGSRTAADSVSTSKVTTPHVNPADKSADKYYANGGSNRVKVSANTMTTKPKQQKTKITKKGYTADEDIFIDKSEDIAAALKAAMAQLADDMQEVVVYVKDHDMLKRTRTAMDLLVSGSKLSSDNYYKITLKFMPTQVITPPTPVAVKPEDVTPQQETIEETQQYSGSVIEAVASEEIDNDDDDTPVINPIVTNAEVEAAVEPTAETDDTQNEVSPEPQPKQATNTKKRRNR